MTGGQTSLLLETAPPGAIVRSPAGVPAANQGRPALRVRRADAAELDAHRNRLQAVARACGGQNLWDRLEEGSD